MNRLANKARIPAGTRARWDWKRRILDWLAKIYPVTHVCVEDIKARTRRDSANGTNLLARLRSGSSGSMPKYKSGGNCTPCKDTRQKRFVTRSDSRNRATKCRAPSPPIAWIHGVSPPTLSALTVGPTTRRCFAYRLSQSGGVSCTDKIHKRVVSVRGTAARCAWDIRKVR